MSRWPHTPVRMCVGCGTRAPQQTLLRFTTGVDGLLSLPAAHTHSGRSAYLHRRKECWRRFAARKGTLRSLRRNVDKATRLAFVQQLQPVAHSAMVS